MTDDSGSNNLAWLKTRIEQNNKIIAGQNDRINRLENSLAAAHEKHGILIASIEKKDAAIKTLKVRVENLARTVRELREKVRTIRSDVRVANVLEHNSADGMNRFFAENPNKESYAIFAEALYRLLNENGTSLDNKSIFDAGVGAGHVLGYLVNRYRPSVVAGMDFSIVAVDLARRTIPSGQFHVGSIYDPFPGQFEFVLCTEVLEHLENPVLALCNVLNSITPGGTALLTTPDGRVDYSGLHINFWSPESWSFFLHRYAGTFDISCGQFRIFETAPYANNFAFIRRPIS